jgi:hypothetical protein
MKRILLFAFAAVSFTAHAQSQRMVLVEEFTNASCGPCASQNPAFNNLLADNMSKCVQLKYQTVWPGTDPMNAQNQSEVADRVSRYGVSGVPQAIINGDTTKPAGASYLGAPANLTQAMINTEYAVPAPLSLSVTYAYNAVTDSITSTITIQNTTSTALASSGANNLKLVVSLTEMNIKFATAPGSNGETEFYYVMRKLFGGSAGTQLPNSIAAGQTLNFTFKEKAPSYIYDKKQMCVIAFVQDFGNNVVHQAGIGYPSGTVDVKCVDQTTSSATNLCGTTITPSFVVTNKGSNNITSATYGYNLNGAVGSTSNWTGNLAPGASVTLSIPAITAPAGVNVYQPYFNNINNGAVDIIEANNVMNGIVASVLGTVTGTFSEDFEANALGDRFTSQSIFSPFTLPSSVVDKTVNSSVTQKLGGFGASDKSFRFNCYNIQQGRPSLIFYKNNINGKGFKGIAFDYAYNGYAEQGTNYYDSLAVLVSTNCGATWTELWKKEAEALKTTTAANVNAANFYPQANEWATDAAVLPSGVENATELVIKFEGRSGWGNNIYVDNIRFTSSVGIQPDKVMMAANVYPTVASDRVNVEASLDGTQATVVALVSTNGTVIYNQTLTADQIKTSIDVSKYAAGVYQLRIVNGDNSYNQSVVVSHN